MTNPSYPTLTPIGHVWLRGNKWPLVSHEGKCRLPLAAISAFLHLDVLTSVLILGNELRLELVTVRVAETVVVFNVFPKQEVTVLPTIALDRIQTLLDILSPSYRAGTAELAAIVRQLSAEVAALPDEAKNSGTCEEPGKPSEVRIVVTVEGGTPELQRVLADLLLQRVDAIPGTRIDVAEPTKH